MIYFFVVCSIDRYVYRTYCWKICYITEAEFLQTRVVYQHSATEVRHR